MTHKNTWLQKLRRLGKLDELKIVIIEKCLIDNLDVREIYWISKMRNEGVKLTNITDGGNVGCRGYKHTDTAKQKISKRVKQPRKPMSKIARRNISKSLIGNTRHLGRIHTEYTKRRISDKKKGTVSWNAIPVIQLSLSGDVIAEWRSATHAAKTLKLNQGNIHSVLAGVRNMCGGYKWKYKNELDKCS